MAKRRTSKSVLLEDKDSNDSHSGETDTEHMEIEENEIEEDSRGDSHEERSGYESDEEQDEDNEGEQDDDNEEEKDDDEEEQDDDHKEQNSDYEQDESNNVQLNEPELDQPMKKSSKKKRPGIVYLCPLPFGMSCNTIKLHMSEFGTVTRTFFQLADRENYVGGRAPQQFGKKKPFKRGRLIKGRVRYSEAWVEFEKVRYAKLAAEMLNNQPVGGKKKNPYYDCLWSIKYLGKGFKWAMLDRRIKFEREIHKRKMNNEIRVVAAETEQYIQSSEIAERLEKRSKLGDGDNVGATAQGPSSGKTLESLGIKQRLTEAEIKKKQEEKKKKDSKYKAKLLKAKSKKHVKQQAKRLERTEVAKSLNLFTGK